MNMWESLLSGLVGALVGGFLTIAAGVWAVNQTARASLKLAIKERRERERENDKATATNLLGEVRDNIAIGELSKVERNHTLVPFITDMWQAHKGNVYFMPPTLQQALRQGYLHAELANTVVRRDLSQLKFQQGYLDGQYEGQVQEGLAAFKQAETLLLQWLSREGTAAQANA
jgi:hypothetical protein